MKEVLVHNGVDHRGPAVTRDRRIPVDPMRRHSISRQAFCKGKRRYSSLQVPEAKRLKAIGQETALLKRLVAGRAHYLQILEDVMEDARDQRRALGFAHSVMRHVLQRPLRDSPLGAPVRALATQYARWGVL